MTGTAGKRLYGLDNWRAILLTVGPVVHSAQYVAYPGAPTHLMQIVMDASHIFRMEAFFAVSGFLTAHIAGHARSDWLRHRLRVLGVPMIAAAALTIPLASWFAGTDGQALLEVQHTTYGSWPTF